jgi:hypothetical protein
VITTGNITGHADHTEQGSMMRSAGDHRRPRSTRGRRLPCSVVPGDQQL